MTKKIAKKSSVHNSLTATTRNALMCDFSRHLGMCIVAARQGRSTVEMRVKKQHLNRIAITHGGAIFSLADKAFAAAANFSASPSVAMNMTISYLRPSNECDTLVAEAREIRSGKRTCLYDIKVFNKKSKKLLAVVVATGFMLETATQQNSRSAK